MQYQHSGLSGVISFAYYSDNVHILLKFKHLFSTFAPLGRPIQLNRFTITICLMLTIN